MQARRRRAPATGQIPANRSVTAPRRGRARALAMVGRVGGRSIVSLVPLKVPMPAATYQWCPPASSRIGRVERCRRGAQIPVAEADYHPRPISAPWLVPLSTSTSGFPRESVAPTHHLTHSTSIPRLLRRPRRQVGRTRRSMIRTMVSSDLDALHLPACPFIGRADDPRTRFTFPFPEHRCSAGIKPTLITHTHQATVCLSGEFASCDRYRAWMTPGSRRVQASTDAAPRPDRSG